MRDNRDLSSVYYWQTWAVQYPIKISVTIGLVFDWECAEKRSNQHFVSFWDRHYKLSVVKSTPDFGGCFSTCRDLEWSKLAGCPNTGSWVEILLIRWFDYGEIVMVMGVKSVFGRKKWKKFHWQKWSAWLETSSAHIPRVMFFVFFWGGLLRVEDIMLLKKSKRGGGSWELMILCY